MEMAIESHNNTLCIKTIPIFDNYGREILFNLGISEPIVLNDNEVNLIINEFKYIKGTYVRKLRTKLQSEGFKIILNPNKYMSNYDGNTKKITIGIKNHNNDAVSYFTAANLSPDVSERYILGTMFLHECSHHILNKCINSGEIAQLNNLIGKYIITSGNTLTKLSKSYIGGDKIKEDITELIRMYIDSPNILKKHLSFLSTTGDIRILNEYKLLRITKEEANYIYNLIENLVNQYLQPINSFENTSLI